MTMKNVLYAWDPGRGPALPVSPITTTRALERRCAAASGAAWRGWRGLPLLALMLALIPSLSALAQTGVAGSGAVIDNRQPSLALNFMICVEGLYPIPTGELSRSNDRSLGEIRRYAGGRIPGGWLPCDGRRLTVGGYPALFLVLGTTYGGDGVNDFALPDLRGRTPLGVSAENPLGTYVGVPEFTLTEAQMPAHLHNTTNGPTGTTGGAAAIDNRQPGLALHHLILTGGLYSEIGEIVIFAGMNPPSANTLPCDGRLLAVSQYAWLHDRIGNRFGGDGVSQFAIPDLRGRVVMGEGQGPGLSTRTLGEAVGADFITLTTNQVPAHTHSYGPGTTAAAGMGTSVNNVQSSVVLSYQMFVNNCSYPSDLSGTLDPFYADVRLFACPVGTAGQASGLLPTDGARLLVSQYSALFSLLGAYYGPVGNGMYDFPLPDTRGRVIMGAVTTQSIGATNGVESLALTAAQLPAHTHASPSLTRLQLWRQAYFGSIANAGNGADGATPFGDGVPNLLKFATGLPGDARATAPGALAVVGSNLEFTFPRSVEAMAEVTLFVEWSDTLEAGSWSSAGLSEQVLETHSGVQTVQVTLPAGSSGKRFLRLGVTP